jgi:hypothetical protein
MTAKKIFVAATGLLFVASLALTGCTSASVNKSTPTHSPSVSASASASSSATASPETAKNPNASDVPGDGYAGGDTGNEDQSAYFDGKFKTLRSAIETSAQMLATGQYDEFCNRLTPDAHEDATHYNGDETCEQAWYEKISVIYNHLGEHPDGWTIAATDLGSENSLEKMGTVHVSFQGSKEAADSYGSKSYVAFANEDRNIDGMSYVYVDGTWKIDQDID